MSILKNITPLSRSMISKWLLLCKEGKIRITIISPFYKGRPWETNHHMISKCSGTLSFTESCLLCMIHIPWFGGIFRPMLSWVMSPLRQGQVPHGWSYHITYLFKPYCLKELGQNHLSSINPTTLLYSESFWRYSPYNIIWHRIQYHNALYCFLSYLSSMELLPLN